MLKMNDGVILSDVTITNKQHIISLIRECISTYISLMNKTFLIYFDGEYIEVAFYKKNFRHLTGIESTCSAESFYKKVKNNQLTEKQIYFCKQHPYRTCKQKTHILKNLDKMFTEDLIIVKNAVAENYDFKIGCTNLKFTLCFKNEESEINNNILFPCSIRVNDDCFSISQSQHLVEFILSKDNEKPRYDVLLYGDLNNIDKMCHEARTKISDNLKKSTT